MKIENFMNKRLFTITWVPLLAFWAFLIAISNGKNFNSSGFYFPFFVYVATSSVFILLVQNEIRKRQKDPVSSISRINNIILCFSVSSLFILVNTLLAKDFSQWYSILILIPLVFNFIIYSLAGFQEEQLTKGYEKRIQVRNDSILSIEEWKNYLYILKEKCNNEEDLYREIERIENIIDYSSFFRTSDSKDIFNLVKSTENNKELVKILKRVT
tara:strand:- start:226 stop:867 length:642 start_codon:yes stop_codon:yes gene_type:complete